MLKIRQPDPDYLASRKSHNNFKLAVKISLGILAALWLVHIINWIGGYGWNRFGVSPRSIQGLWGVLAAPWLHGGWQHLFSNTLPLFVLLSGALFVYPNGALRAIPAIYLGSGAFVWIIGRSPSYHIGASGLVYGLLAYVFFSGIFKLDTRGIALTLLVAFLYGSMAWGILPFQQHVSWEYHLGGALAGFIMALATRKWDRPPRKVYDWELEDDEADETGDDEWPLR